MTQSTVYVWKLEKELEEARARIDALTAERDALVADIGKGAEQAHARLAAASRVVEAARALREATSCVVVAGTCENETHHLGPEDKCVEDGIFLALDGYEKAYSEKSNG